MERVIREFMLPVLRETYADLLDAVQKNAADLLVSQILILRRPPRRGENRCTLDIDRVTAGSIHVRREAVYRISGLDRIYRMILKSLKSV